MTAKEIILERFGAVALVTDGAREGCEFIEVTNESNGKVVTLELCSLMGMTNERLETLLDVVQGQLGI